ncbi:MAG: hypothetical protein ABIF28_09500 [Pseudomonadota bacterium]
MKLHAALGAPLLAAFVLALPVYAADAAKPVDQQDSKIEKSTKKIPRHSHVQEKSGARMPEPTAAVTGNTEPAHNMTMHHHPRDR